LLAGSQPEADEQVGFAGAGVTERDDRLAGVDPRAGCQGCELSGDAGDDVGVEVRQLSGVPERPSVTSASVV
jgi:hypothetical protein